MLQALVPNQEDGWTWTLAALEHYYDACASQPFPGAGLPATEGLLTLAGQADSPLASERVGLYLDAAATLGRRTAELHAALGAETDDPSFAPEPLRAGDLARLATELRAHAEGVFDRLKESLSQLPDDAMEHAGWALGRRRQLLDRFAALDRASNSGGARIRVHGDYHLGQVLRVMNDFIILDFEGEPARTLAERRAKHSPLKDVAGMLRSFNYAAGAGLLAYTARRPDDPVRLESWARLWERATAAAFLRAYRHSAGPTVILPPDEVVFQTLLDAFLLDKALYELAYELNNRPAWVRIPLRGILSLQA
jgi:maltose alpha-D-glucosyltransferase / alpha-amylase